MADHCNAVRILTEFRLSRTPHRISVLGLLIQAKQALSAGAIAGMLKERRGINKVTVYRMLSAFRDAGIVREIATDGGIKYYEMACIHNPAHPHFYCLHCGAIACLPEVSTRQFGMRLSDRPFKVQNITVNLSGVCARCQKKV